MRRSRPRRLRRRACPWGRGRKSRIRPGLRLRPPRRRGAPAAPAREYWRFLHLEARRRDLACASGRLKQPVDRLRCVVWPSWVSLRMLCSTRGRAGGTGRHLIDPHGQSVAADSRNRQSRHHHCGQKQKRKDFHAPAARPSIRVVARGGHFVSHLFGISDWTASRPLPAETVCNEAAAALIWIKASENRQRPVLAQGPGRQDLACWTWAAGLGLLDLAFPTNTLFKNTGRGRDVMKFGIFY